MAPIMADVKSLVTDPKSTKPRSGPTVATQVDLYNIAFAQFFFWIATNKNSQEFDGGALAGEIPTGAIPVLALFLVRPEDSAGLSKKYSPFNVLFLTEGIKEFLAFAKAQMGRDWQDVHIIHESLSPPNFSTAGLMVDGKRMKIGKDSSDGWLNIKSVTDTMRVGDEAPIVMKNFHPLPLPTLEYRIYVPFNQKLIDIIEGTSIDYANTFPPDDGSGDWFYRALAAAMDMPRRLALKGIKFTDIGNDHSPSMNLFMARFSTPKPENQRQFENPQGFIFGVCPNLWGVKAPGYQPSRFRPSADVIDYSPWAFFCPSDNTPETFDAYKGKGFDIWDDEYVSVFNQSLTGLGQKGKFDPLYTVDDGLARLPALVANYYKTGFNHTDGMDLVKYHWFNLAKDLSGATELGYDGPGEKPPLSGLLHELALYVGSDPTNMIVLSFWPIHPSDPMNGYTGIGVKIFKFSFDVYKQYFYPSSPAGLPPHSLPSIPLVLESIGLKPYIEFQFNTDAPQRTFLNAFIHATEAI